VNFGNLAQGQDLVVTPEGTIQLVGLGSVYVQGLTLSEAKMEIDERYRAIVGDGLDATPVLRQRAPRFVFVLGEVRIPGQFPLQGPTTVSQAIAMAGGWNVGANLRQIVIFRRNDDWRLMATKIDLAGALYGERPNPSDEIFVRDSDVVLLPKSPILRADDWISLIFTRGLYSALPGLNSAYSVKASQL
jgi:polysaccharide export outer membrane protein